MRISFMNMSLVLLLNAAVCADARAAETKWQPLAVISGPQDYASTPWKGQNIPAGTKLLVRKGEKGGSLYRLEFVAGVWMEQDEDGRISEFDMSGRGAVICSLMMTTSIKGILDQCFKEEVELRNHFDLALNKMSKFVVANSLTPISEENLMQSLNKEAQSAPRGCAGAALDLVRPIIAAYHKHPSADFQKQIDRMLALPRPPVGNPCL